MDLEDGEIEEETIIILDDEEDENSMSSKMTDSIIEVDKDGKPVSPKPIVKSGSPITLVNLSDEESDTDSVEVVGILCANPTKKGKRRCTSSFEHVRKAVAKAKRTAARCRKSISKPVIVKPKTPKAAPTPRKKKKKRTRWNSNNNSFCDSPVATSSNRTPLGKAPERILFSSTNTPSPLSKRQKKRLRQSSDLAGKPLLDFGAMQCSRNPFLVPIEEQPQQSNRLPVGSRGTRATPLLRPSVMGLRRPHLGERMPLNAFPIHPGRRAGPRGPRERFQRKVLQYKNYSGAAASSTSGEPSTSKSGQPRPIIIDGSNVAVGHGGPGKAFSSKGIKICVDYFKARGHKEVFVFLPKYRLKNNEAADAHILRDLENEGVVKCTPSREAGGRRISSYDDRYIVQYAHISQGIIVSNDNFRDLYDEEIAWRETITNRILPFLWMNDVIMFPPDPLGKNGPTLDDFLVFP